jgi:hypothetical protein
VIGIDVGYYRDGLENRAVLETALPYQVAVSLTDGDGYVGALRRLYCSNLNIGPGHESAIVHDIAKLIFCFADLCDANRFRSQFGGKLLADSRSILAAQFGALRQHRELS